ncbi:hypothetical protein HC766_02810 [Candidatus Gracilibacteria bacterium]|nr:hypothetical protein [Candidatus Gracilibacteria bacterium]
MSSIYPPIVRIKIETIIQPKLASSRFVCSTFDKSSQSKTAANHTNKDRMVAVNIRPVAPRSGTDFCCCFLSGAEEEGSKMLAFCAK